MPPPSAVAARALPSKSRTTPSALTDASRAPKALAHATCGVRPPGGEDGARPFGRRSPHDPAGRGPAARRRWRQREDRRRGPERASATRHRQATLAEPRCGVNGRAPVLIRLSYGSCSSKDPTPGRPGGAPGPAPSSPQPGPAASSPPPSPCGSSTGCSRSPGGPARRRSALPARVVLWLFAAWLLWRGFRWVSERLLSAHPDEAHRLRTSSIARPCRPR